MTNMKLGTKILLGFCALLAISVFLGGMAIYRMNAVKADSTSLAREYVPVAALAGHLERRVYRTMYAMRGYGFTGETSFYDESAAALGEVKESLRQLDELAGGAVHLAKLKEALAGIKQAVEEYEGLMGRTHAALGELREVQEGMNAEARGYTELVSEYLEGQKESMQHEITEGAEQARLMERLMKIGLVNDLIELGSRGRVENWKSQAMRQPEVMAEALKTVFPAIEAKVRELEPITRQILNQGDLKGILARAGAYKGGMEKVLSLSRDLESLHTARLTAGGKALEVARNLAAAATEQTTTIANEAQRSLGAASTAMILGLGAALLIGVVIALLLTRSITGPIRKVIEGLNDGADQVASASTRVSSASQSLAEGAGQQAAAIEETSSSLEEMASMTRQNAENAQQANGLMEDARRMIDTANTSVGELTQAMTDITRASEETSKIIKTIDEIAFQTNLLALNAAVEAARAGEAGAGFAVVADEVRNLAMRAAEAARSTASLIEDTVKKVKDGSDLMARTNEAFQQVAGSAARAAGLVGEISAASGEQAQGIDQINRAVSEMDKVTQQNAANAEESAASSGELNAQAEAMKDMVGSLVAMVGRANGRDKRSPRSEAEPPQARAVEVLPASSSRVPAVQPPRKSGNGKDHVALLPVGGSEKPKANPTKGFPPEDEPFDDF